MRMTKTIFDLFGEDVDRMIELNKQFRKHFSKLAETISRIHYAEQCCTIHIDIGRRTGKTTYIAMAAKPGDLVLVANQRIKQMIYDQYGIADGVALLTADELDMIDSSTAYRHHDLTKFNTVYVDEPRLVFAHLLQHRFYSILVSEDIPQTFVFLGK